MDGGTTDQKYPLFLKTLSGEANSFSAGYQELSTVVLIDFSVVL